MSIYVTVWSPLTRGILKPYYPAVMNEIVFLLPGDTWCFGHAFGAQEKGYWAICKGKLRA